MKMKPSILLCVLAACGQPQLSHLDVKSVTPNVQAHYNVIAAELDTLGYGYIMTHTRGATGVVIVGDTSFIAELNKTEPSTGIFYVATNTIYLPLAGERFKTFEGNMFALSGPGVTVVLAHEIGHAFGLAHSDHGLMTPGINLDCINTPGACLVAALKENGNIF